MKSSADGSAGKERPNGRANGRANGHLKGHGNGNTHGQVLETSSSPGPPIAAGVETPRIVATRGPASQGRGSLSHERPAESDDDRGISAAGAATNGAACAENKSCADPAGSRDPGILPPPPGKKKARSRAASAPEDDPRLLLADAELPDEASIFADEMSLRVNLFEIYKQLLLSDDEKVCQRALERILEMKYGKIGPGNPGGSSEEAPRLNFDGVMGPLRGES